MAAHSTGHGPFVPASRSQAHRRRHTRLHSAPDGQGAASTPWVFAPAVDLLLGCRLDENRLRAAGVDLASGMRAMTPAGVATPDGAGALHVALIPRRSALLDPCP